jgi:hypothetical protein
MFLALDLWQSILCNNGRVDILACDVNPRAALLKRFLANASAVGIQVYYSTNRTGGPGGDWVLEHNNGVSPLIGSDDIKGVYFDMNTVADIKTSFLKTRPVLLPIPKKQSPSSSTASSPSTSPRHIQHRSP